MSEPESLAQEGEEAEAHLRRHALDRLVMLCDGVFAIAITLAAIEIRLPDDAPTFAAAVNAAGLQLFTYLISFVVIAGFWISNRDLFARVVRVDRTLTSLTLAMLCVVALIPAAAHGAHVRNELTGSLRFYALVMVLSGVANFAMWSYAAFKPGIMASWTAGPQRKYRMLVAATIPLLFGVILFIPTVEAFKWTAPLAIVVVALRRWAGRHLLR